MKPSILIKLMASSLLDRAGFVTRRIEKLAEDKLLILMYHRVVSEHEFPGTQAGMFVEPQTFDMHLQYLTERFDVVPLSEWRRGGKAGGGKRKPTCVLTFDDGWSDFYDFAFPILSRWSLPATVFLPTGFIGTNRSFWTDRMAEAMRKDVRTYQSSSNHVDGVTDTYVREILMLSGTYVHRLERAISLLKKERVEVIERVLDALRRGSSADSAPAGRSFVDWNEVDRMRMSGLISFGSHTENHPILTTLDESEVRREIRISFDTLIAKNAASRDFLAFCYPNGNHTARIAEVVREEGGHLAVTTEHGWAEMAGNPYSLSRVGVHQDISSSRALFAARVGGYF